MFFDGILQDIFLQGILLWENGLRCFDCDCLFGVISWVIIKYFVLCNFTYILQILDRLINYLLCLFCGVTDSMNVTV